MLLADFGALLLDDLGTFVEDDLGTFVEDDELWVVSRSAAASAPHSGI